ncbi:Ig-like domain-containing protein [Phosphitispora sp. TUW77]|uniref:Ig-like domain-containing protein n=1 Tax=Phosphitispora sp. TUW77 TaxID=3152361 RepID=UPI003AB54E33
MRKGRAISLMVILSLVLTFLSPAAYGSNGTKGRPAQKAYGVSGKGVFRGGSDKGKGGGGAKKVTPAKDSTHGKITLEVTIVWPQDVAHPDEVDVILTRDGIDTVVTTEDGVATFISEASGDCYLKGEDVPGFLTPEKPISLTGDIKSVQETLEYIATDISVESVNLNKSELEMITGYPYQLVATVLPSNASNRIVYWKTSDESVATVADGLVQPLSSGPAIITVTTADGDYTAACDVTVVSIESLADPDPIAALKNELVIIPETVTANLDNGINTQLEVTWTKINTGEVVEDVFRVPLTNPDPFYTFIGSVAGTEDTATLVINVDQSGQPAVPVVSVGLNLYEVSLYVGDKVNLTPDITPDSATTQDVIWTSSDTNVAIVENGTVTAAAPGSAIITVETIDGGLKAYCLVSVALAPEPALIFPTQESFNSPQEVCVNVAGMVYYKNITEPTEYYVKVEQKGSSPLLGEGIVTIGPDTTIFNVYDATHFIEGNNYSHEYYLSMSTDPRYPKNDELTLKTNFKIGTAVPTISIDNIKVSLDMIGGPFEGEPGGIIFLLCRELDLEDGNQSDDISQLSWEMYCVSPNVPYDHLQFTDEVKMMGRTNAEGVVEWTEPREPLKLGGYVLLEVTPEGYITNLNLINPESDDGTLLKEVHLNRDAVIERDIINNYIGDGSGPWSI